MKHKCHLYKSKADGNHSVWRNTLKETLDETDSFYGYLMKVFKNYSACMHSEIFTNAVKKCIPLAEKECQSSSLVVAKILRMNMENVDKVLAENEDWKIVHQVRDPRAVLVSQRASKILTHHSGGSIITESQTLCDKMLSDIKASKKLKRVYPDQIHLMRYEDYADNPVTTLKQVYSFIGMEINPLVIKTIKTLSNSMYDSNPMDQHRKDSGQTSRRWVTKITSREKEYIDKDCIDVYRESGYPLLTPDNTTKI